MTQKAISILHTCTWSLASQCAGDGQTQCQAAVTFCHDHSYSLRDSLSVSVLLGKIILPLYD